jgi:flagellar biosynthesis/type III secretory pathway protein FliH
MFEIDGDDILFRGVKVGHLSGGWPTLQDQARGWIEGRVEDYVHEDDVCEQVEQARKEGYEDGKTDAEDSAARDIEAAEERGYHDGQERGFAEGRGEGYQAALVDIPHAADVARINLLLASCNKAYALLNTALRQKKAKDCRDSARAALLELADAARKYSHDA